MQHPAHRKSAGGRHRHQPVDRLRLRDIPADDLDLGAAGAHPLDLGERGRLWPRSGVQHDTPGSGRRHLPGQEQAQTAQAAGDDVGAVGAEHPRLLRWNHHRAVPDARDRQDQLAGVFGGAHHANGGGGLSQRVVSGLWLRQHTFGSQPVDGVEQLTDLLRMRRAHQGQIHAVEGQVAAEREQSHPGVAVNVLLPDLDEPTAECQQIHTGPLGGAGQRVQHDIDAVAVGVLEDLLSEVDAARVVDVVDAHASQHFSTLTRTCGGVDLGASESGDGDGGLADTTGGGVNQDLVTGLDPGQVLQAVPGCGRRGGDCRGLVVAQPVGQCDRYVDVAGDEGAPAAVG